MTFIRPGINIYAHIFGFIGGFAVSPIVLAHAVPFSIYRNRRRRAANDGTVQFDPNRWTKKKRIPSFLKKNILCIIIGILVLFEIGRAHVLTPVTWLSRMQSSALEK